MRSRSLRSGARRAVSVAALVAAPQLVHAFELARGEDWAVTLDTTVTAGIAKRVQAPADDLIGKVVFNPLIAQVGNAAQREAPGRWSVNSDDADRIYDDGDIISRALKITSELGIESEYGGAFVRASYFYDAAYDGRSHLSREARDQLVSEFDLLDAFVYTDFDLADRPVQARFGRQVSSWGESTFIQNGINVTNAVDLSKLRVAGAELKEALLPVNMLAGSIELDEHWSIEAQYLLEFEQVEIDPVGSYFSANDFAGAGGRYVMVGFGLAPQPVINPDLYYPVCHGTAASDDPVVAANPALRAAGCAAALPRLADSFARDDGQFGVAVRYVADALNSTEFGLYALNYHSRLPIISGRAVTSTAANSAALQIEYPEDIRLYGASFNTTLDRPGIALQGEVSYRDNAPLQIDDVEILFAALSPLNPAIPAPVNRFRSQLGQLRPGEEIPGYERHEVGQWQMTASKVFGAAFGADQWVLVTEAGGTKVFDLPPADVLRYQGDGTDTGGGADVLGGGARNPITQVDGFATPYSWGYRALLRADYGNAFGLPVTLVPRIAYNHDVNGTSPGPGGNFLEGRRALTTGIEASYLNRWSMDLAYTRFSGAGALNTLHDRDFVALSLRYAF